MPMSLSFTRDDDSKEGPWKSQSMEQDRLGIGLERKWKKTNS
jgi:hypothetical protein